jgi:hypothetical protein
MIWLAASIYFRHYPKQTTYTVEEDYLFYEYIKFAQLSLIRRSQKDLISIHSVKLWNIYIKEWNQHGNTSVFFFAAQ